MFSYFKTCLSIYRYLLVALICLLLPQEYAHAQEINYSQDNQALYSFLDEMYVSGYISLNQAVRPYSRMNITEYLENLDSYTSKLNQRQQKELAFFQHIFSPESDTTPFLDHLLIKPFKKLNPFSSTEHPLNLIAYRDTRNILLVNPMIGMQYWSNHHGTFLHRWTGGSFEASLHNRVGLYLRYKENYESDELERAGVLTQRQGANYRSSGKEYVQINSGITYTWKWGYMGLLYDNFSWGSGYSGINILSGKAPTFAHIKLNMKPLPWLEMNYIHGWLYSMIIDSSRSYNFPTVMNYSRRDVYRPKYIAANMLTFTPFKRVHFSLGNSIIYSDYSIQLSYLIPVMIYRIADTDLESVTNTGGNNSQFFFDLNCIPVPGLQLYSSLFIDELSFRRMWDTEKQSNYISWKAGGSIVNAFGSNISLTAEYTRTHPEVYRHVIPTTTFASHGYTLGHYLNDNAEETYFSLLYKPLPRLYLRIAYSSIRKGPDYESIPGSSRLGLPFLEYVVFKQTSVTGKISYLVKNNVNVWTEFCTSRNEGDMSMVPEVYRGNTGTMSLGLAWGM